MVGIMQDWQKRDASCEIWLEIRFQSPQRKESKITDRNTQVCHETCPECGTELKHIQALANRFRERHRREQRLNAELPAWGQFSVEEAIEHDISRGISHISHISRVPVFLKSLSPDSPAEYLTKLNAPLIEAIYIPDKSLYDGPVFCPCKKKSGSEWIQLFQKKGT